MLKCRFGARPDKLLQRIGLVEVQIPADSSVAPARRHLVDPHPVTTVGGRVSIASCARTPVMLAAIVIATASDPIH